uniref:hypothetical protein n=8 Tax=Enterobacteriaceae TaxID=543 RepID=UPI003524EF65
MESITKQLVNIGHGMSAEVAKDEPAVAKLLVELSSALDVQYERGNALEARCAALAAENGILLAIMNEQAGSFGAALAEGFHDAVMESGSDQLIDIYQRRLQQAIQCIPPTTSTDAFLAEVRAQGVTEYASKRGFSFQHGCIHAHFGNGDVMVGAVTFEN